MSDPTISPSPSSSPSPSPSRSTTPSPSASNKNIHVAPSVNPGEPAYVVGTTLNNTTGLQTADITNMRILKKTRLLISDLIPGSTIEFVGADGVTYTVTRGAVGTGNENSVRINNQGKWYEFGEGFKMGKYIYRLEAFNSNIENFNDEHYTAAYSVDPIPPESPAPKEKKVDNKITYWLDYVFYLVYPVSFIGALFYGFASVVQVDPSTIIANRNWAIIINAYIGICAVISIFIWFNYPIPVFNTSPYTIYNQNSYRKSIYSKSS